MKIDVDKVIKIKDQFLGMFFVLAKDEKYIDCLLGFLYAVRSICNFSLKSNLFTEEQLNKVTQEINAAADKSIDENFKAMENIIKQINGEEDVRE